VFVDFDFLAQATAMGSDNAFGEIQLSAFHCLKPAIGPTSQGVVPVQISLVKQEIATLAQVTIELAGGATEVYVGPAAVISTTQLLWNYDLALVDTTALTFWMKLPAASNSVSVNASDQTGIVPFRTESRNMVWKIRLGIYI
jgi:hypothetical protein